MITMPQPQTEIIPLCERPAWKALRQHHAKIQNVHLRQLFAEDPQRGERFAFEALGLYFDYSKNRITDETIRLLLELAKQSGLRERIDAMFGGEKINVTEKRAVLHVALRATKDESIMVDGANVVPEVHAVLDRMTTFREAMSAAAQWKGHTGKRIRNVINIGIGGSDLGPVMAYEALKHYSQRDMTFRFVSNVDGTDFAEATRDLKRRRDALHRLLQDLHDARDDDQRTHRPRVGAPGFGRREGGRAPLRRSLDQHGRGREVRHRHRQHVRVLGLGRRALLDGLGDRSVDDDRDWPRPFPRDARRLPRDG